MLTKYFIRDINIQKYSNEFLKKRVFSRVGRLSLLGFDEISEAVFEKAEQERKRVAECTRTNVTCIELCLTKWQGQTVSGSRYEEKILSLEVKM